MSGPCIGCGAPTARRSTWCSQVCHAKHRRKRVQLVCVGCGAAFERMRCEAEISRYCSMGCRLRSKREHSKNYPKVGRRALHRIVMEQKLGRKLRRGEVVHHINGDKLDFRPENLELLPSHAAHMKEHWASGSMFSTHEQAVARGMRSGEVRRAKRDAKGCLPIERAQGELFERTA